MSADMRLVFVTIYLITFYSLALSVEIDNKDVEIYGLMNFSVKNTEQSTAGTSIFKEYSLQIYPIVNYYLFHKFYAGPNLSLRYSYLLFEKPKYDEPVIEYTLSPGMHCGFNIVEFNNIYPYLQAGIEYAFIKNINESFNYHNDGLKISIGLGVKYLLLSNVIIYVHSEYCHSVKYWHDSDFKNYNERFDISIGLGGLIKRLNGKGIK